MALRVKRTSRKRWVLHVALMNKKFRRLKLKCLSPSLKPMDVSGTNTAECKVKAAECTSGEGSSTIGISRAKCRRQFLDDSAILPLILRLSQREAESWRSAGQQSLLGIRGSVLPGSVRQDQVLPCGLRQDQAYDLMSRDLTPEDFEILSKLDEGLPKRNTADTELVKELAHNLTEDHEGKECGVCLSRLDKTSDVVKLPCGHPFHAACITKWLTQCKNACPICGLSIQRPATEQAGA